MKFYPYEKGREGIFSYAEVDKTRFGVVFTQ